MSFEKGFMMSFSKGFFVKKVLIASIKMMQ
jgi:hypothetical protein